MRLIKNCPHMVTKEYYPPLEITVLQDIEIDEAAQTHKNHCHSRAGL